LRIEKATASADVEIEYDGAEVMTGAAGWPPIPSPLTLPESPVHLAELSPDTPSASTPIAGAIGPAAAAPTIPQSDGSDRFRIYSYDELPDGDAPFLVEGIIPQGTLCELHGPPGAGKSFAALSLALSVAADVPFLGCPVIPGPILYVASERFGTLRRRIDAWCKHHGADPRPNLRTMQDGVQLAVPDDVTAFVRRVHRTMTPLPHLIVLDTLSRSMVGRDENGASDMTRVIDGLDRIRQATDATVLLVHHTRKAGDMERGSSVLRGATDIMMSLKTDKGQRVLQSEKTNDEAPFKPLLTKIVSVGRSAVLVHAEDPAAGDAIGPTPTLSGDEQAILRYLSATGTLRSVAQVASDVPLPRSTAHRVLSGLLECGLVARGSRNRGYEISAEGRSAVGSRRAA
jgi:hypothetical protein